MSDLETNILHFLVEKLGGHQVRIVRPGVGTMVGFSVSNRKTFAIRDLLDLVNTPSPISQMVGSDCAEIARLRAALTKISSPTQSTDLLWWQVEARAALAPAADSDPGEHQVVLDAIQSHNAGEEE